MGEEKTGKQSRLSWLTIALISVAFLLVLSLIMTTFKVPYSDVETYTEKEPYTDENCITKPLVYKLDWATCNVNPGKASITVTNLDQEEGGSFTFWVGFKIDEANKVGAAVNQYIYPLQSKSFGYDAPITAAQTCWQEPINIPMKKVCTPVTRYNDVDKQRIVTKYQTILNSIIHPKRQ